VVNYGKIQNGALGIKYRNAYNAFVFLSVFENKKVNSKLYKDNG
jgi:hypothetical protein